MERTASAHRALYPDLSPMQLDLALADGQAYPKTVHVAREPHVEAVKGIEDPREMLGCHLYSLIADADLDPLLLA
jgi:hypothetical protein